ncbi:MAG TPA: PilN domain-containing protein [Motiliproteus sp.]
MIRQQINLFIRQEKVRVPFSAAICSLIVLVVILSVAGLYAKEYRALQQSRAVYAELLATKKQQQQEIEVLQQQNQARKVDPRVQGQRDQLQQELKARQLYGRMLDQLEPEQQLLFSNLLQGLSNQAVKGVWLTRIMANDGGAQLLLEGETAKPELIPRYLRNLGNESSYGQASFGDFQIKEQQERLRFVVKGLLRAGGRS